jgi:Type II CAAX prenyl endopeptidase Rce1-like
MQQGVSSAQSQEETERYLREGSGPLADLALTLPIFVVYHLGVVWMDVQNAADLVTRELKNLANSSLPAYSGLTLAIGVVFAGILLVLGRGHTLRWQRFALVAAEGILYAVAMRLVASYVVGKVHLAGGLAFASAQSLAPTPTGPLPAPVSDSPTFFTSVVLSLGAGLYEEIAFRVGLYGLGRRLVLAMMPEALPGQRLMASLAWAALSAAVFSGWHYFGQFGEPFELRSFLFRWVCGVVFTLIYVFRGFAPVVWTHALYDIWVLAF